MAPRFGRRTDTDVAEVTQTDAPQYNAPATNPTDDQAFINLMGAELAPSVATDMAEAAPVAEAVPAVAETNGVAVPEKVKRTYHKTNLDINIADVEVVEDPDFGGRKKFTVPEDHALRGTYALSLDKGVALRVVTDDPASTVKILDALAKEKGNGMKVDPATRAHLAGKGAYNGGVTFKVLPTRAVGRGRKPKTV